MKKNWIILGIIVLSALFLSLFYSLKSSKQEAKALDVLNRVQMQVMSDSLDEAAANLYSIVNDYSKTKAANQARELLPQITKKLEDDKRSYQNTYELLRKDVSEEAQRAALRRHSFSNVEEVLIDKHDVTSNAKFNRDFVSTYRIRLRGALLGSNVFEISVSIKSRIEKVDGKWVGKIIGREIHDDKKIR